MLDALFTRLENENALALYASDHGESLGANGNYLHGNMQVPEQRHPAMMLWASPSFARMHKDMLKRRETRKNTPVTHDTIFHSVLDCAELGSELIDPKLSLCAPYAVQ